MIKILNTNKIVDILNYFKTNNEIYFPKTLNSLLTDGHLQLRNLIFNQYIIPIAEMADSEIKKLALFDFRSYGEYTMYVLLMCGNIDKNFLEKCYKKILENNFKIKKISVRFLSSDLNSNIVDLLDLENFEKELEVKLGDNTFYQFSSFYE